MKLVAVTSCPTGIAHTYMAAEGLEQAAKEAGHEITVETQGSAGAVRLSPDQIAAADAVIFAADVEVRDRERFAGKPLVTAPVKRAIQDPLGLIAEAQEAIARGPVTTAPAETAGPVDDGAPAPGTKAQAGAGFGTRLRGWLMTGVSYMIPFVAAGGILIALGFLFGGAEIATKVNGGTFAGVTYQKISDPSQLLAQAGFPGLLFFIGNTAFGMLVPILAGFIAYGMADRPGLVPGVVGGLIANAIGAGFLGGLAAGLLAGTIALWMTRIKVPRTVAGVMPVMVIPLISTLITGLIMIVVIGQPIAAISKGLNNWLGGLTGTNAILLGALVGLMMAFDMGGPVNKTAYTFALAGLATGNQTVMAAVMAAGMVPPIALALATVIRPKLFTKPERVAGEAGWLLGASFITEGAIPFAAADPLRVIPPLMIGSGVTGALSMTFGAKSPAPHGGIWVILLIGKPLLWLLAVAVGVVVGGACVVVAKSIGRREEAESATPAASVAATAPAR
jgi:PTS system fructose-specific IIC component